MVEAIKVKARESQKGLARTHPIFKKCDRIQKCCSLLLHDITHLSNEEECGYRINRLKEYGLEVDKTQSIEYAHPLTC